MKTLDVMLILSLTVLSVLPTTIPRVRAVSSNGNNYWSAFGPRVDNLLYKVYMDFTTMFSDFTAGQLDITDWPIQPADLGSFTSNPDFWVKPKEGGFATFQLDMNHQDPLLTMAWQCARTATSASCSPPVAPGTPSLTITGTAACGVTCPSGFFQLIVHLTNLEEGGALVKDANNLVTATITGVSSPTATKADDADPAPAGTYTLPVLSSIPASYVISTSMYSGSVTLFTSGTTPPVCLAGQTCTADLSVNYNSPSTKKPSVAGIEISRALSHLLDKPSFLTGPLFTPPGGTPLADCDDVQVPPRQNLMAGIGAGACNHSSAPDSATIAADCAEHSWMIGCPTFGGPNGITTPVSLYNLSPDNITGAPSCTTAAYAVSCFPTQSAFSFPGYSGINDLRAACDHLVNAGFTIAGTGGCLAVAQGTAHLANPAGSCNTSTGVGCIIFYIRTHSPRKAFGTIIADELNALFGGLHVNPDGTLSNAGGTVCYGGPPSFTCSLTPVYFFIAQVASIVFSVSTVADWNLYTGQTTGNVTPEVLWFLYHSQFASNLCGGASSTFPNNYPLYCDPVFDTQANAGEFLPSLTFAGFQQAAILGATRGATVPVYSGVNAFVALNAWNWQQVGTGTGGSLVPVKVQGFIASAGFWSTLNMRPVPGYVPANSSYYASGCNPSTGCEQNTIRRSMAQTTLHISPYVSTSDWEFEPLDEIYDSMLEVDPNTGGLCQTQPGGTAHCIDWMTTSHSASFDATTGKTAQTWNLRSDIFWHDGQRLTAHDVCFTILSYRDAPSANFFPRVSNVVSCTAISSTIAQVVLTGQSPFDELNIGGLLILPEHVWANVPGTGGLIPGTDQVVTPSALVNPSFDPVAAGDMVGSGLWVCNPSVGVSTIAGQASCTQNGDGSPGGQAIGAGGRILLKRNLGYMRCCPNAQAPTGLGGGALPTTDLQALEWADANKDGRVTILDIAAAASKFGKADPYFAHPLYSATPSAGTVDIGDIATVAFFLDHGLTAPFLGTPTGAFTATPPAGLTQVDPVTDPFRLDLGGGNLAYYLGASLSGTTLTVRAAVLAGTPAITVNFYTDGTGTLVIPSDGGGHALVCSIGATGATVLTAVCTVPVGTAHFDIQLASAGTELLLVELNLGV